MTWLGVTWLGATWLGATWLEQRGAALTCRALCSSSCAASQPRRSLDTLLSSAAANACTLLCCGCCVILAEACLHRRRVPHALLVQEGSGRGAAVHRCGGAGGSALRRDARALPCFASIRCILALMAYTEGWWWGWAGAADWFCHRRGAEWTERSHASYTTRTTCNLHNFLDDLFVSTLDTCLKETCCCVCKAEEKRKPGNAKPGHSKPVQLQARSLKPSHSKPSQ